MTDLMSLYSYIIIFLVLSFEGFSLYLPLRAYLKNSRQALVFLIPTSISFNILLGYFFYTVKSFIAFRMMYFVFVYITLVIVLNIVAMKKLGIISNDWDIKNIKIRLKELLDFIFIGLKKTYYLPIILLIPIVYTRLYYPAFYLHFGDNDTWHHLNKLLDQMPHKHGLHWYAPGFHILIYPLKVLIPTQGLYRFTGSVLSLITAIYIYIFVRSLLKERFQPYTQIFIPILLSLPLVNMFTIQTMAFTPSALSFIFILAFLYVVYDMNHLDWRVSKVFCGFWAMALSLTVPYSYGQFIVSLVFLWILMVVFRKRFNFKYELRYLFFLIFVFCMGIVLAYGHVKFRNLITLHFYGTRIELPLLTNFDANKKKTSWEVLSEYVFKKKFLKEELRNDQKNKDQNNDFISEKRGNISINIQSSNKNQKKKLKLLPNLNITDWDRIEYIITTLLSVKDIRTISTEWSIRNLLAIGSYAWILFCFGILFYSIFKKNRLFFMIAIFNLSYGLFIQTGIFAAPAYKGRSGWYLMLGAILASILLFNYGIEILRQRRLLNLKWIAGFLIFLYSMAWINPPSFYRKFHEDIFKVVNSLSLDFPDQRIEILTNAGDAAIISMQYFRIKPVSIPYLKINSKRKDLIKAVILEKKIKRVDPFLSGVGLVGAKDFEDYDQREQERIGRQKEKFDKIRELIQKNEEYKEYKSYFENENIEVYIYNSASRSN